ncbi:conserved hypothetical protein [Ricinus communis]|uniref:Uncharacterized protein n=1 Tax=Ricinus communis TaxID=3988 RepID=B9TDG6_RICCO|nr:conserved hypothetical protein [Ricinus communis]
MAGCGGPSDYSSSSGIINRFFVVASQIFQMSQASRACCKGDKKRLSRGDPVTIMNVEEWGILLVTVPMFRRTNAAGGVQNRPAEMEE